MFRRAKRVAAVEPSTARDWVAKGADLLDSDLATAEQCYLTAVDLDPTLSAAWFDLGLIAKWQHRWDDCIRMNRAAVSVPGRRHRKEDPAYWNAGIAATAIRDWETARWAWTSYGITIPDGEGPIDGRFGFAPVRLPEGETVWGWRIDPARVRLVSIPFPESGFRCHDIVLHDGAPSGSRVSNGREYPVFDVIERWEASPLPTISVEVMASLDSIARLTAAAEDSEIRLENWTRSVVFNCEACSMGRVDFDEPGHDHRSVDDEAGSSQLGVAGPESTVRALLDAWQRETGTQVLELVVHDDVGQQTP